MTNTRIFWIVVNEYLFEEIKQNGLSKDYETDLKYNKSDAVSQKKRFESLYNEKYYLLKITETQKIDGDIYD